MSTTTQPRLTDIGPPSYDKFLSPLVKKNYGKWKYHENVAPGVLCHVSESGDRLYSVRAASPRLTSIQTLRLFASLADKYCGGYLRFTSRNNVEFLLEDKTKIEPLKKELAANIATRRLPMPRAS
jgi:sulfite reductase beta subunit